MTDTWTNPRGDVSDVLGAARRGELSLHYQPILCARDHVVVEFEALLRWDHPEQGRIDPATVVALAERGGQGPDLDRWILLVACRTAATWPPPVRVAVNVSPTRLACPSFAMHICDALEITGLEASRLTIEIVERAPIPDHPAVAANVGDLKALGVSLALDDFLTHYSSLTSLTALAADTVKIDRSFVAPLNEGRPSPIVEGIVHLAHGLGLRAIAEGIETPRGEAAALDLGCELLQGHLYSPAVPAVDTARLIRGFGHMPSAERAARR